MYAFVAAALELAVLAVFVFIARRTRRLVASQVDADVPERVRAALGGASRVADVMAMELAILYYAFASWRRRPFVPAGGRGFSYHRRSGYAGLLYAVVGAVTVEMVALDFLVRARHSQAANVLLVIDLFAAAWLLGFARAVQLRPIIVTTTEVRLRSGLRWALDIPRDMIDSIETGRVKAPSKGTSGYLRLAPGEPNTLITLREPMRAVGSYGSARTVSLVGATLDDATGFREAIGP
jgi:hypothetical protein